MAIDNITFWEAKNKIRTCEAFRLQKEIKTRMAIDNITFWEAKNKISGGGTRWESINIAEMPQQFAQLPSRFVAGLGYDKVAHKKLLSPDAIPVKKLVYFSEGSWGGTKNRNTSVDIKKSQLCSKSGPQANAIKGIEEVNELTKLHEKLNKTSGLEKRIVELIDRWNPAIIGLVETFNCQGFLNNKDPIVELIDRWNPAIIGLVETHIDNNIIDTEVYIEGYEQGEEIENLKIATKFNEYFVNSIDDIVDQSPKDNEIYQDSYKYDKVGFNEFRSVTMIEVKTISLTK
ncbi:hypothetical protein QE152_g26729 [Popillia japonica]|uniref:Restriction endonuclease n=1 Tax=Popillia japonica TaxID=7064 RepID=A0AAW1JWR4_POPJA